MTWQVAGIASTIPADPGWRAVVIDHDADGKPVETVPGITSISTIPVAKWALVLSMRVPPAEEASIRSSGFSVQTGLTPLPLGLDGNRLDCVKGYRGLAIPGEPDKAALERLIPQASPTPPKASA